MPVLPSFETPRLVLRPRTTADLPDCLTMDRDPEVVRYIDGPWADPAAHRAFVEARITAAYPDGLGYWTVRTRMPEAAFLGWVLLIPLDGTGPEIEIGWRFNRASWGQGYATEAAAPVLAHARDTLGVAPIADIHPDNAASMRVAEKSGDGAIRYAG
ncbi:GNAT family N-acetyltransferase [Inquilinus sp. CA228]|uniref:GNAT family N-acetyltransferase n=1 Tax=Inquilinus sp. CA228 TaxID=3455609 RepID=UPI003F8D3F18